MMSRSRSQGTEVTIVTGAFSLSQFPSLLQCFGYYMTSIQWCLCSTSFIAACGVNDPILYLYLRLFCMQLESQFGEH